MKIVFLCLLFLVTQVSVQAQKQSLQLSWNGPPGWQTNGLFNVRWYNPPASSISNYLTWPLAAVVTNAVKIKFYNVNPTQFYAISWTNAQAGFESTDWITPVTGQYNWQGVAMTAEATVKKEEGVVEVDAEKPVEP